jgi:hypothetical protein
MGRQRQGDQEPEAADPGRWMVELAHGCVLVG